MQPPYGTIPPPAAHPGAYRFRFHSIFPDWSAPSYFPVQPPCGTIPPPAAHPGVCRTRFHSIRPDWSALPRHLAWRPCGTIPPPVVRPGLNPGHNNTSSQAVSAHPPVPRRPPRADAQAAAFPALNPCSAPPCRIPPSPFVRSRACLLFILQYFLTKSNAFLIKLYHTFHESFPADGQRTFFFGIFEPPACIIPFKGRF